jgi:hypothetical protein
MTTNQSVVQKLQSIKTNPDGELSRLLEYKYEKPKPFDDDPLLAPRIIEPMRLNSGHAAPIYIKYLMTLSEDVVMKKIAKWKERFHVDFGMDTVYRYYDQSIGAMFAGGEIAMEAGIIDWDLERIYKDILARTIVIRDGENRVNKIDYDDILGQFQNKNLAGTLIFKLTGMIEEPRMPLIARIEAENRMYYVSSKVMKDYLRDLQVNTDAFLEYMKKEGKLVFQGKKRLTDGWGGRSSTSPISLYGFKSELPSEVIDDGA